MLLGKYLRSKKSGNILSTKMMCLIPNKAADSCFFLPDSTEFRFRKNCSISIFKNILLSFFVVTQHVHFESHVGVSAGGHKPGLVCTAIVMATADIHTHLQSAT